MEEPLNTNIPFLQTYTFIWPLYEKQKVKYQAAMRKTYMPISTTGGDNDLVILYQIQYVLK